MIKKISFLAIIFCLGIAWVNVVKDHHETSFARFHASDGGAVGSLAFSPDGKTLASLSMLIPNETGNIDGGGIQLWNVKTKSLIRDLRKFKKDTNPNAVSQILFSPDGKWLVSIDFGVNVWDTKTWKMRHVLNDASWATFSPDGKYLSVMQDGRMSLVNTTSWEVDKKFQTEMDPQAVAFSPDGKLLAGASYTFEPTVFSPNDQKSGGELRSNVRLWDTKTGRVKRAIKLSTWATAVAFSTDDRSLVIDTEKGIDVWNVKTGVYVRNLKQDDNVSAIIFLQNGVLISAGKGLIEFWDLQKGTRLYTLKCQKYIRSMAVSADNSILACGDDQGLIHLWKLNKIKLPR